MRPCNFVGLVSVGVALIGNILLVKMTVVTTTNNAIIKYIERALIAESIEISSA